MRKQNYKAKVHYKMRGPHRGLTFCGIETQSRSRTLSSENWEEVTCGSCIQRSYSVVERLHNKPTEVLVEIPN